MTRAMHREIMGHPQSEVDHINRNKLDNRRANLREASKSLNGLNRGPQSNNTSGIRGVDYDKNRNKWCARLKSDGVQHHLGRFETKEEAVVARRNAEAKYGVS